MSRRHWTPRRRARWLAAVPALLIGGGLPLLVHSATADFGAGQAARYNRNLNGDFLLVGNTALKCSGQGKCTEAGLPNDYLNMVNSDPDGAGPRFNGSSTTFTIPSGSTVDAAYLWWGANLGTTRGSGNATTYYCTDDHEPAVATTADKSAAGSVQFKVGAGAYTTLSADKVYTSPSAGGLSQPLPSGSDDDGLVYEGVRDVTAALSGVAAATATTVSVADIQAMQGPNCFAGWALVVVYRFADLNCLTGSADNTGPTANLRNDYRNIAIYDGLLRQQDGTAATTTTLSGFLTAQPSVNNLRLGVLAWEGDQFIDDDQMKVKSNLSGAAIAVDPAGPSGTGNFFDSAKQPVADHNASLGADPDAAATIQQGFLGGRGDGHGMDAKTQPVSVPGGTSAIDVTFTTAGDQYYPGGFALSSPLSCLLQIEKDQAVNGIGVGRDNSTTPAPYVKSGDVLTYTVPVRVLGALEVSNVVVSDAIPANTSFVGGSIKVGTGATPAAALGALAPGGTSGAGSISANLGTLTPLSAPPGSTCPEGRSCFGVVRFEVVVNAGVAPGTVLTNQADVSFSAGSIDRIKESSNRVTDRVGATLTLDKNVEGAVEGDPEAFSFTVTCNGAAVPGSPFSLGDGQRLSLAVPPGQVCTVTEATDSNFSTALTGDITENGGSTLMNEDRSVTFTNSRRVGKIVVTKTIEAIAGDARPTPTFEFTVTCPGVTGYPRTLTVRGSGSAETPADVPYGASCTVTEAAVPGWLQSGSVSIDGVDQAVERAAFTNTRQSGSLGISKATVGGDATFTYAVDCDGTTWDVSRSITTTNGAGAATDVTGIPAGTSCTVTEAAQNGWEQTVTPPGPVTIVAGQTATASFTNTRRTADLIITKVVSGTYAVPVIGTFPVAIDCGADGTFTREIIASSSANGTATVAGLPVGASCTLTETNPVGWQLATGVEGNTNPRTVRIAEQGNAVRFTNRRTTGIITIDKTIDQGSGTFRFAVTCGETPVAGGPFDITINAPATTGSVTVPDVPTGSSCVVDETPNGSVAGEFVQVTPADDATVRFESTVGRQTASFVDRRRVGDLVVKKVFPAESLGDPSQSFTFTWNCGPEPRTATLKAGEQKTITGIPTGTACVVSESAAAGYTTTVAPSGGAVVIDEQAPRVVTFTNTAKTGTLELRKKLSPAADPGRFDLNVDGGTAEATNVGDGGTTGVLTLRTGSHSVAEAAAGTATVLADYDAALECRDTARDPQGSVVTVSADSTVVVGEGSTVVCTYTNTRRPPPQVDLAIVKTSSPATFVANQQATYRMTVSNNGPATATGIAVSDPLPAGVVPATATGTGWTCTITGQAVACQTASSLASGASLPPITVTANVTIQTSSTVTNTATVSGAEVDRDLTNNTSSVTNPIAPPVVAGRSVERTTPRAAAGLAVTGSLAVPILSLGGMLLALGAVLVAASRRRRAR